MRKGDIVVNPWVSTYFNGELNPNYATIYLGDNKSLDYKGRVCEWADKIYKDNPKRETPWKVIGHIDLYGIAELAIRDAVYDEENKTEPLNQVKPTLNQDDDDTNGKDGYFYEPKDEPQTEMPRCSVNGTPFDECGFCEYFNCDTCKCEADEPQTDAEITELAKEIVHKMIDNSDIAEDAYPDLRQRMHEAVERLDEYYPSEDERSE